MKFDVINGGENKLLSAKIFELENYAENLEYNCLYLDVLISLDEKTEVLQDFLDNYNRGFSLISADDLMSNFFINDLDYIRIEDYDVAGMGIAAGLYVMNEERRKKEKDYVPLTKEENIFNTLENLFPNPNDFVKKYEKFRSWQVEGYEPNAGVLWVDQVVELAYIQDEIYKKKVYQEAVKISLKKVIKK